MLVFAVAVSSAHAQALEAHDPAIPSSPPPPVDGGTRQDIINGKPARRGDFGEAGGLILEAEIGITGYPDVAFDARMLLCSATLIAPDVVLTAAHCVDEGGLQQEGAQQGLDLLEISAHSFVFSPAVDLTPHLTEFEALGGFASLPRTAVRGSAWVAHPGFDIATFEIGLARNDDIGLLFLDEPTELPFSLLPSPAEGAALATGDDVVIVGWGQQQQGGIFGTKQIADSFIAGLGPTEMKIGEEVTDGRKCHGDSGGPTFLQVAPDSSAPWRVIGVTSHAYDYTDCNETGGVDTRVDAYLDWIDAEMRARCEDGSRAWCLEPGIIAPPDEEGRYSWEVAPLSAHDTGLAADEGCGGCAASPAGAPALALLLTPWLLRRRSHRDRALPEA